MSEKKAKKAVDNKFAAFIKENLGIMVALAVMCIFLAVFPATSSSFLTPKNVFNILRQISTNMLLACGMTMVIILGGIDLSVGSIIALSGVLSAGCVARYGLPIPAALLVGVLVGLLIGCINGGIIALTTIPPFIVTLATMNVARGLAKVYTGGSPVRVVTKEWQFLGAGYIGPVPVPVIIMIVVVVISALIMNRTKMGRHIYAVGGNAMSGGSGKIGGTVIGALIIGILNNGLNLLNVNSFWQDVVKGIVILLAVLIDYFRTNKK